jgi:hypothetical protein
MRRAATAAVAIGALVLPQIPARAQGASANAPSYVAYASVGSNYTQIFDSLPFQSASSINTANPVTISNLTCALGNPFDFASPVQSSGSGGLGLSNTLPGWYGSATLEAKFGATTGDQSTGGILSFGQTNNDPAVAANRALGLMATSSTGGTAFGLRLVNLTGISIGAIDLSFSSELWRQTATPKTVTNYYYLDLTGTNGFTTDVVSGSLTGLSFAAGSGAAYGTNGPLASNGVAFTNLPLTTNWPPGAALWLVWEMTNDAAGGQGIGIDNLSFSAPSLPPVITTQPLGQSVPAGNSAAFSVAVSNAFSVGYQWYTNDVPLTNGNEFSGTDSSTLTISSVQISDATIYTVIVSNQYGSVTSSNATLYLAAPPTFTAQPMSQTTNAGSNAVFSVTVVGAPLFDYQWFLNGKPLFDAGGVSGAQSALLTLTNLSAPDSGSYTVVVSNPLGAATSSVAFLDVLLPPFIAEQPLDQLLPGNAPATLTVTAGGTPPLYYHWEEMGVTNLPGATNSALSVASAGYYRVVVSNLYGSVTSGVAQVSVESNITSRPSMTLTITSPSSGGRTSTNVTGRVTDSKLPIWNVLYSITNFNAGTNVASGHAVLTAGSPALWSVGLILPGTNIIAVQAFDFASNHSAVVTRKFFYEVAAPLNLQTIGSGSGAFKVKSFAPGGQPAVNALNIGQEYQITAEPAPHSLFGGWTRTTTNSFLSTNSVALTFLMESNLIITAAFESNLYLGASGTYNGLFMVSNILENATENTAGLLGGLVVRTNGDYSGKLWIEGAGHAVSGAFDAFGRATNKIPRPGGAVPLEMTLDASVNPPCIHGTVSNSGTALLSDLYAVRAGSNWPKTHYTMLIPPATNGTPTNSPGGDGYALIASSAGSAKTLNTASIRGALADGATFSQTVAVSEDGYVPFYDSLYGNKGLLLGWVSLPTNAAGNLVWIRPKSGSARYPNGFTNATQVEISPWVNPLTAPTDVATLANLVVAESTTDTNDLFRFDVKVSKKNYTLKMVYETNYLTGSINPNNGLLEVTFGNSSARTTNGFGAILQNGTNEPFGGGYFLNRTTGQAIQLTP